MSGTGIATIEAKFLVGHPQSKGHSAATKHDKLVIQFRDKAPHISGSLTGSGASISAEIYSSPEFIWSSVRLLY
jgi:hypothetical protein